MRQNPSAARVFQCGMMVPPDTYHATTSYSLRNRIGAGGVAHHVRVALGIERHLPDREALSELQEPAFRQQVRLARPAQEVEAQVGGDGERHRADMGED